MKKLVSILAVLSLALVIFAACGKNEHEPVDNRYYWEKVGTSDLSGVGSSDNWEDLIADRGRLFAVAADSEGNPVISIKRVLESAEQEPAAKQPEGDYYSWVCTNDSGEIFSDSERLGRLVIRTWFDRPLESDEPFFSAFLNDARGAEGFDADSVRTTAVETRFVDGRQVKYARMTFTVTEKNEEGEQTGSPVYCQAMTARYPVRMPDGTDGIVVIEVLEERPSDRLLVDDTVFERVVGKLMLHYAEE